MMTDERLAELERLCAAATPGPWKDAGCFVHRRQHGGEEDGWWGNAFTTGPLRSLMADDAPPDDARFIAASRTAVPELIAEVRRLRAELAATS